MKPHKLFEVWRPDEVAECLPGVLAYEGLYATLWQMLDLYDQDRPASEVPDDFQTWALARKWEHLSPDDQEILNALATREEMLIAMGPKS